MKYFRFHITTFLVFLAAGISVCLGIILPGRILGAQSSAEYGEMNSVPEAYYSASNTAMAKAASLKLDTYQRLQLITGRWESTIKEAAAYEMELESYEAVNVARETIEKMYNAGIYPEALTVTYENWYTWEASSYKAVDATFGTYAAYYWVIQFNRYDELRSHTIYVLEDGTVFLALSHMGDEYKGSSPVSLQDAELGDGVELTETSLLNKQFVEYLGFTDLDLSGFYLSNTTGRIQMFSVEKESESFLLWQKWSGNDYLFVVLPEGERVNEET